jgi:katanin p80 WD40 repeat-containing subunit B1
VKFPEQCVAAHNGNVNCLSFGHKSGQIMVSGGEDRVVNVWSVDKDQCVMVRTFLS